MALIRLQGEKEKRQGIYYQVESTDAPIGTGGMGQVFKGMRVEERTGISRPVAIKFMYEDLPAQAIERARREASIQLRNDNLVEMLGFIETTETTQAGEAVRHYHVVSELLTGVSLSDIFEGKTKDRDGNDVPFAVKMLQDYRNDPSHFAQTIIMGVLSGLMALHDAGYIHRDIDPSNIMLTSEGHIKLIDFGIAKQMNLLTTNDKGLTVAGAFMGKPEYAAPELALGDIKHQNQTTDIYAMGILLYQCIVGHTPFEGPRHEILERQIKGKLPLGAIKDRSLRNIIATACEKKQEQRYQSAAQMRVALENMSGKRRETVFPYRYAVIGVVALLLFFGALWGIFSYRRARAEQQEAQRQLELQEELREQKLNHVRSQVGILIAQAARAMVDGKDYDRDYYENSLMQAYALYEDAEQLVCSVDSIAADTFQSRLTAVGRELGAAVERYREQERQSLDIHDQDGAAVYGRHAYVIDSFMQVKHIQY